MEYRLKYEQASVIVDNVNRNDAVKEFASNGYQLIWEEFIGISSVKLYFEKIYSNTCNEDVYKDEDTMIRASRKSGITREDLVKTFTEKGLVGVYNLGLKSMLDYLNNN